MNSIDSKLGKIALDGLQPSALKKDSPKGNLGGPNFEEILNSNLNKSPNKKEIISSENSLRFSNHALDRIRSRGITMGPEQLKKLNEAVDKAAMKGAKETLILLEDSALIVNIKNKTVVTALDKNTMKENVFTNIDSTVIL